MNKTVWGKHGTPEQVHPQHLLAVGLAPYPAEKEFACWRGRAIPLYPAGQPLVSLEDDLIVHPWLLSTLPWVAEGTISSYAEGSPATGSRGAPRHSHG